MGTGTETTTAPVTAGTVTTGTAPVTAPPVTAPVTADDLHRRFGALPASALVQSVTLDQAVRDFAKLRAAPAVLGMHRQGVKANEYCAADQVFRAYRIQQHNGVHRPTLYAVWESPRLRDALLRTAARLFGGRDPDKIDKVHILTAYKLRHGCISLFRPMVAKYLFSTYSPRGRVLDFCAGWGGRLLGALASGNVVSYVGIDSNPEMAAAYRRIVDTFGSPGAASVRMVCSPAEAVDYASLGRFDCVVTSPPYFGVEVYRHQPRYRDYEDWMASFFLPVLRALTRHIDADGAICINIRQPETERRMVREMARLGWRLRDTLLMRLPAMPGKGSRKADREYGEPIYVFERSPSSSPESSSLEDDDASSPLAHAAHGGA